MDTFVGYDALKADGKIQGLIVGGALVDEAKAGDDVLVLLDQTAFYAQSGGQVGDNGVIESADGTAKIAVSDCRYGSLKRHIHYGKVESGSFKTGQTVISEVNRADRMAS